MEYRIATKNDIIELLCLYKQLFPNENLDISIAESIWDKTVANNTTTYFIAVNDCKIISSCNISIIQNLTRQGRPFGVIEIVITDRNYRRQGIGSKVINNAIEFSRQNNCYKVLLLSSIHRKDSHDFYEKIGFNGNSKKGFEIRFEET